VLEDGCEVGSLGWALADRARTQVRTFALPQRFLDVGDREAILDEVGLAPQDVARAIVETVAGRSGGVSQQFRSNDSVDTAASAPTTIEARKEEFRSR
jgi:1-deoxy-D-xylulose-5-phosphate synthase